MKKQTGFTLVELVIVIAVLGILAGMAIPHFMEAREEAAKKECLANRTQITRMFYAQQAVGYIGDLDGFLKEVTEESDNENKYFTFVPKCVDGGEYTVVTSGSEEDIECTKHGGLIIMLSMAEKLYNDFQNLLSSFFNPDGTLNKKKLKDELGNDYDSIIRDNQKLRDYFLKKIGAWEKVQGNGQSYDLAFHTTIETGDIVIYATVGGNQPWKAAYIYDSANKKWYTGSPGYNLSDVSLSADKGGKTEAQVIEDIKAAGWTEVTLNGSTFSK